MDKIKHIYIFGASGSGTSTLGNKLSKILNYPHLDTDDYLWLPSNPPFQERREKSERIKLLKKDIINNEYWILTGSLVTWGINIDNLIDLAVYLWLPNNIRINRLIKREKKIFGEDNIKLGGEFHDQFIEFIRWAASYDTSIDLTIRSKRTHEMWMKSFSGHLLKVEGDFTLDERINTVIREINQLENKNEY